MTKLLCVGFLFAALFLPCVTTASAQSGASEEVGLVPDGSFVAHTIDSVNVANRNAVIQIPLFSLPQLGKLKLSFSAHANTTTWQAVAYCFDDDVQCEFTYVTYVNPYSGAGTAPVGPSIYPDQGYAVAGAPAYVVLQQGVDHTAISYSVVDSTQGTHTLFFDATNPNQLRTVDGSKLLFLPSSPQAYSAVSGGMVLDADGTQYGYASNGVEKDVFGNTVTENSAGTFTDSIQRSIPAIGTPQSSTSGCPDLTSQGQYQPAASSVSWTVPGPNGNVTYLICYANIAVHTNFWGHSGQNHTTDVSSSDCGDPNEPACNFTQSFVEVVESVRSIQSIVLPNKTYYGFIYDAANPSDSSAIAYGTINKIILPTGGSISYGYTMEQGCYWIDPLPTFAGNNVWSTLHLSRRTENDDQGHAYAWSYSPNLVTDPNNNDTTYAFNAGPVGNTACVNTGVETSRKIYQGSSTGGTLLETIATTPQFGVPPDTPFYFPSGIFGAFPTSVQTTIQGQTSSVATGYDNSFQATQYDCSAASGGNICTAEPSTTMALGLPTSGNVVDYSGATLKSSVTAYKWQSTHSYKDVNLLNTPSSVTINDGAGHQEEQTTTSYDESSYISTPNASLGVPTTVTLTNNAGASVQTHTAWTPTGMVDHTVDGKNVTNAQYTYGSQYDGLYPTIVANIAGQSQQYSYDLNSGLVTSVIDANKNTTSYAYTSSGDLQDVSYPGGGSVGIDYHGYAIPLNVTTTTVATPDPSKITTLVYDGLGRPTQMQLNSDSAGTDYVDTTYDGLNNVISVSNPYRLGQSGVLALSQGTTSYVYDVLGRKMMQCQPDNGTWPNPCTAGNSYLKWSYAGNTVTFKDETGRQSQRTTDALGRLTKVMESNPSSGALTTETDYTYDALNNLWRVDQYGGPASKTSTVDRIRTFTYDSLSRLLCASNPENSSAQCPTQATSTYTPGTVGYSYDLNSNLVSKEDARGVTIGYSYDALNRLINKSSAGGSGISGFNYAYIYDVASIGAFSSSNSIGRLVEVSNQANASEQYSYDPMGRVILQANTLPDACCGPTENKVAAQYNLAGNLKQLTYPDGQVINQLWNGAGEVSQITDSSGYQYLTTNSIYLPNGTPEGIYRGNGVADGKVLNNRSRIVIKNLARVGATGPGTSSENPNFMIHEYCYGPATTALASSIPGCPTLNSQDNGDVHEIMDALSSPTSICSTANSQCFNYDLLNRLSAFRTGSNTMNQSYSLDAWGNMSQASGTATFSVNFDNNNHISATGIGYDSAGNLTTYFDGVVNNSYGYDAESKLVNVNNGAATYTYDADGNRIRKDTSGSWTEYIHFNGQPIAEKNDDGTWSNYIFANGERLARMDNYDIRVHVGGTNCSNCGSNPNMMAGTAVLTEANGHLIKAGDMLTWRQYSDNSALGGIYLSFTDGTNGNAATDTDGEPIDADVTKNSWHVRMVDLSQFAGKTISQLGLFDGASAPAGAWDIYYGDISLVSTDGTFIEIYHREQAGSPGTLGVVTNPSVSNLSASTQKVADTSPLDTVTYYHGDQIGSTRLLTAGTGWPVASATYYPYGEGPQAASSNHYLFTGKERDTESGLDYFGARYYASSMGRFMSPDPGWFFASRLENPQTWNLYSYALNNPLTNTDPDGYDCVYLNNAGNGVESVDQQSNSGECGNNGGYWVDGTATKVTLFTNSNDVGLSGQIGGNQLGQGQSTDAFYSSVNATEQDALETSTDVNNTMLPGVIGPPPNIRYTVDPYQIRLFGTHWCGAGGAGVPVNALDAACKAHDQCFEAAGISAANNAGGGSMTLQQAAAAQGCNAALGAAATAHPEIPGSTRVSEWLKHGDQLLPILGIDGHLAAGTAIR